MAATNGKLKSSDLQDELVRISAVLEEVKRDEDAAHAEIKALARAAIQPDAGDALKQIKAAEGRLGQAKMIHRRLHDARDEVEADLAAALAQEAQTERERNAAEAKAFAETLPGIFADCDKHFAAFHQSFSAAIAAVNQGRGRGWNLPSQELFQAKLIRAVRTQLSIGELRMLNMPPMSSTEQCSFESLGQSYAKAIAGGALHAVKPPAPPQPRPQAAKSNDRLPPKGDIGQRFRDDAQEFEIRTPFAR